MYDSFFLNHTEARVMFAHVLGPSWAHVTPACSLFFSSGCITNSFLLFREIIIFLFSKAPFQIRDANGVQNCPSWALKHFNISSIKCVYKRGFLATGTIWVIFTKSLYWVLWNCINNYETSLVFHTNILNQYMNTCLES